MASLETKNLQFDLDSKHTSMPSISKYDTIPLNKWVDITIPIVSVDTGVSTKVSMINTLENKLQPDISEKYGKGNYVFSSPSPCVAGQERKSDNPLPQSSDLNTAINIGGFDGSLLYAKRLHPAARLPLRATPGSAGYDLFAYTKGIIQATTIHNGSFKLGDGIIKTGISIAIPERTYGRIAPRSGLAVKNKIHIGAGVIDSDYRGEVGVVIFNFSGGDFHYNVGDKIAQLILEKCVTPEVHEVAELPSTVRGSGGFGSTGR